MSAFDAIDSDLRTSILTQFPSSTNYVAGGSIDAVIGLTLSKASSPFLQRPVEALLDEIALLLERCRTAHQAKQELEIKAFDFWLDQCLAERRLSIKDAQIAAGELQLPLSIAQKEQAYHGAAKQLAQQQKAVNLDTERRKDPAERDYQDRVALAAQVAVLSAYQQLGALDKASRSLSVKLIEEERLGAQSVTLATSVLEATHASLEATAAARAAFESQNEPLLLQRHDAEKTFYADRRSLATTDGSSYNYKQRLAELQAMFDIDFEAAYLRCIAAAVGLASIFGISRPLPDITTGSPITSLVLWLRGAIENLSEITDQQDETVLAVSLKEVMSAAEWKEFVSGRPATLSMARAMLPFRSLVRLTSIGANVISTSEADNWAMEASPPKSGTTYFPNGNTGTVDHSDIPMIVLPNCRAPLAPGANVAQCGGRRILNMSPLGDWQLRLREPSALGNRGSTVSGAVLLFGIRQV